MKLKIAKVLILFWGFLIISSCSQPKGITNRWTLISTGAYEAILYKSKLKNLENIEVIKSWDSIKMSKLIEEIKAFDNTGDSLQLNLKSTREGGFHGSVYLYSITEQLGLSNRFGVSRLNRKERKLFDLHNEL
jgi:hypothetical protein